MPTTSDDNDIRDDIFNANKVARMKMMEASTSTPASSSASPLLSLLASQLQQQQSQQQAIPSNSSIPFAASSWWKKDNHDHARALMSSLSSSSSSTNSAGTSVEQLVAAAAAAAARKEDRERSRVAIPSIAGGMSAFSSSRRSSLMDHQHHRQPHHYNLNSEADPFVSAARRHHEQQQQAAAAAAASAASAATGFPIAADHKTQPSSALDPLISSALDPFSFPSSSFLLQQHQQQLAARQLLSKPLSRQSSASPAFSPFLGSSGVGGIGGGCYNDQLERRIRQHELLRHAATNLNNLDIDHARQLSSISAEIEERKLAEEKSLLMLHRQREQDVAAAAAMEEDGNKNGSSCDSNNNNGKESKSGNDDKEGNDTIIRGTDDDPSAENNADADQTANSTGEGRTSNPSSSNQKSNDKNDNEEENKKEVKFTVHQAENWMDKYEELLQFHAENGHCFVPNYHPENPSLAQWTKRQRYQYKLKMSHGKRSTITNERIRVLDEIGFVWDSHKAIWSERYEQLKNFRKIYGHCNVPSRYQSNQQLAVWVKRQRRQRKNKLNRKPNCMTDERQKLLDSIGFVWDMKKKDG